ncbi:MAG: FG-GAP repeat protein [Cyanobacteria bacterium P01_H01_bin.15]
MFDANTGDLLQKFTAPDGVANDSFRVSVSLDDGLALLGSRLDDDKGADSGSAYLFEKSTGNLLQKFTAPDGTAGDEFGFSVSLDDGLALIDAYRNQNGSAYLFDADTGKFLQKLNPFDGVGLDRFEWSLSLDNDDVLIGAYLNVNNAASHGAAYLFGDNTPSSETTPEPLSLLGLLGVVAAARRRRSR